MYVSTQVCGVTRLEVDIMALQTSEIQPHKVPSSHNFPFVNAWLEYLRAKANPSQRNGKRPPRMRAMRPLVSWRRSRII